MLAMSLWNPWCWSVAEGIKLIENRTWEPPAALLDGHLAIHAAKKWSDEDLDTLLGLLRPDEPRPPNRYNAVAGAVVAVCRLVAVVTSADAAERIAGPGQGRWFFGPYGWVLADMQKLAEPVPCRGYQRLWRLTGESWTAVLRQTRRNG